MQPPIQIFVTGGTFDKEYDELTGNLLFKKSHITEVLKLSRSSLNININVLMMIDSLSMTNTHRTQIAKACKETASSRILITHGTDTMTDTAAVLAEEVKNKTIVLTGAMVPYHFGSSDGMFNLGSALAFVQSMSHGVYIVMNGKIFTTGNVRKNKTIGMFEEITCS